MDSVFIQRGNGAGFTWVVQSTHQCHYANIPYSSSSYLQLLITRTKTERQLGTFKKAMLFDTLGKNLTKKVLSHSVLKRLMWLHAPSHDNHHVIQLAKILTNVRHQIHKMCVCVCVCVCVWMRARAHECVSLSTPTSLGSSASKITTY